MSFLFLFFYLFFNGLCDSQTIWRSIPDVEPTYNVTERLSATGVIYKDHLYVFGGIRDSVPNITYSTPSFVIKTKNIPQSQQIFYEPLNYPNCVIIKKGIYDGCVVLYGGVCEDEEYNKNTLIMYNISSNTYEQLPNEEPNPGGRKYHDMFVIGETVYLYGGISNSDELDRRMWYYNLNEKSWNCISTDQTPPPRYKHSGSLYCKNNGIYKITATTQLIFLNDIWQYSFQAKSWITVDEIDDQQFNRQESSVIQWNEYMIIYSGYDTYHLAKDILCLNVNFKESSPKWKRLKIEHINAIDAVFDINENDNIYLFFFFFLFLFFFLFKFLEIVFSLIFCKLVLVTGQSPHYNHKLYYLYLSSSMIVDFPIPVQYYIYKYATISCCVLITLICCCTMIKCIYKNNFLNIASISDGVIYLRNGATVVATPADENLVRGLSICQIKRIKELTFNSADFHNQNTCTICLVDFIEGDKIKVLPCQHIYHINCIMEWLYKNSLCPLCKRNVVNKKGYIEQDIEWVDI